MKNLYYIKYSLLLVLAFGIIVSCDEDFYTNEIKGGESPETFFQTDEGAYQGVLAGYLQLASTYADQWETPWTYRIMMGDEVSAGGVSRGSKLSYEVLNEYDFDANNLHSSRIFNNSYQGIGRSNVLLDNMPVDSPERIKIAAEAKFLRAFNYFDLVTIFGEAIPLVTKELSPDEYQQPPAAAGAVWAQIEKDLTEAIAVLPLKSAYSQEDKIRANKGAAQALLGKAYLYQGKYALAVEQFEAVISSGEFDLAPDYTRIWRKDQEFGMESLFELSYTENKGTGLGNYRWGGGNAKFNTDNVLMLQFGPFTTNFDNMESIGQISDGFGCGYPLPGLFDAYVAEGDEVRRNGTMITEAEFLAAGVTFDEGVQSEDIYGYYGYLRTKLALYTDESGGPIATLNNGTNWRVLRFGDVLLMAAEAQVLSGGDLSKARNYINRVRTRVQLGNTTATDAGLMDAIINERRLELSYEGYRFPDLVRWNNNGVISDTDIASTLDAVTSQLTLRKPFNPIFKLAPIPQTEINTNPNMKQNPGY
ncbi:RagB/SusD family nutrient uptake outer membrane protein [Zobellia nedashkovskayae]